jgi:hypothetical protein
MERSFKSTDQVHLETDRILNNFSVDENLIWLSKSKSLAILAHQLAVLL